MQGGCTRPPNARLARKQTVGEYTHPTENADVFLHAPLRTREAQMFLLSQSTHRMVVRYHPEVGHLYVPNLRARLPNENGGFYVVTNSDGFRSDSEFVRPRGDRPRILFLGDSFTAGDGCDNEDRFAEQVGQLLEAEVFNYAVAGTGTDQQLLIYEKFARDI